jgi:circadian clock protein KaiC
LDEILKGGLPANRFYLVHGSPGAGKTTLALQFLLEGVKEGEKCLYITLSETKDELIAVSDSHGWNLSGIDIVELSAIEGPLLDQTKNTLFHPAEVELQRTVEILTREVERFNPARVVFDSLSEIRLLAQDSLRYRRQMLSFKQYFAKSQATVLLLDDHAPDFREMDIQSLAHGVISLNTMHSHIGSERRQLRVTKIRGAAFQDGLHDYAIKLGGLEIYPRSAISDNPMEMEGLPASSGIPELDSLLGGGLDRGTSNLIMSPSEAGKSTVAAQFAFAAAERGEKVAIFLFEENLSTFIKRTEGLGMGMGRHIRSRLITIHHVDAAEISPGQFASTLRQSVERDGVKMVVIDSLNGYLQAMPEEKHLILQLHEMLSYLNQKGVVSILLMGQHGLMAERGAPVDLSYLADTVILLRFYEHRGALKKVISVIKKRSGSHEDSLREMSTVGSRLRIGAVLTGLHGVMQGAPVPA